MLAFVTDLALGPAFHNDFEGFLVAFVALFRVDVVRLELKQVVSFTDTEVQAAVTDNVHQGEVFSGFQRVVHRQTGHTAAQANVLGGTSRGSQHDLGRRNDAILASVVLSYPSFFEAKL